MFDFWFEFASAANHLCSPPASMSAIDTFGALSRLRNAVDLLRYVEPTLLFDVRMETLLTLEESIELFVTIGRLMVAENVADGDFLKPSSRPEAHEQLHWAVREVLAPPPGPWDLKNTLGIHVQSIFFYRYAAFMVTLAFCVRVILSTAARAFRTTSSTSLHRETLARVIRGRFPIAKARRIS